MSFTIAHLTDAHLSPAPFPRLAEMRLKRFMGFVNWKRSRERTNDMGMLGQLVADMISHKPDHIAVTGDVVNLALSDEFRRAVAWLKTLGEPKDVSFTPGNHDAYVRDAMQGLKTHFAAWTTSDGGTSAQSEYPYLRVRGEVALIGLNSGAPTAPLMASGRLGAAQVEAFRARLKEASARDLARVVLIHHPPLSKGPSPWLRGLEDARAFEAAIADCGAEAVLHGHTHKRMLHWLPSRATRVQGGKVPVLGAPSCSAAVSDPRQSAAYALITLAREGDAWRVRARMRGPMPGHGEIGERDALLA